MFPSYKPINSVMKNRLHENVGVFVGGTSGIGEATAYKFAEYTTDPHIYVIGRSAEKGNHVLENLSKINQDRGSKYYFLQHDVTDLDKTSDITKQIAQKEKKVNLLMLTSGGLDSLSLPMSSRLTTEEGRDVTLTTNYYGRMKYVTGLLPLLDAAAASKENARVITVLDPSTGGKVNFDDLDLKEEGNYSFKQQMCHTSSFNSLAMTALARTHPNVMFMHAFPGIIATSYLDRSPFYLRALKPLFKVFGSSPEEAGEKFFFAGAASEDFQKGAHLVGSDLKPAEVPAERLTPEAQAKVWQHTLDVIGEAGSQ